MVADIRWLAVLYLLAHCLVAESRVIDDDQEVFGVLGHQEDPYEDGAFEEDRYEEPMMGDQPSQVQGAAEEDNRPYRPCTSPADCYPDECCRIGMQRYSEPSCMRLGSEGEFCRVGQEPVNTTLNYPDGSWKDVTDGHILFCPCAEGLTCLRALCRPYKELYLMDKSQQNAL